MSRPLYQRDPVSGEHYVVGSITYGEEIVVPEKIEFCLDNMPTAVINAIKINQIIDCLEQIKERAK